MRPFSETHLPVLSGNPWLGDSTLRPSGAKTRRTSAPSTFRLNESQASSSNVYIYSGETRTTCLFYLKRKYIYRWFLEIENFFQSSMRVCLASFTSTDEESYSFLVLSFRLADLQEQSYLIVTVDRMRSIMLERYVNRASLLNLYWIMQLRIYRLLCNRTCSNNRVSE